MIPTPPPRLVLPSIDYETYSEAGYVYDAATGKWLGLPNAPSGKKGLKVVGAAVYAQHPSTDIVTFSYDLLDGRGVRRWRPGVANPLDLFNYIAHGGLVAGWNTSFEHWIWNWVASRRYQWPHLPLRQLRCTAARARAWSLPPALGKAAAVMGWFAQKDPEGERLIQKFSIPRNQTKHDKRLRITRADDPVDAEKFDAYCDQDVVTEQEAARNIPELTPDELEYWLLDQEINHRGVQIDVQGVDDCCAIIDQAHAQYNAEIYKLTGGMVEKASQLERMKAFLAGQGVFAATLDEDALDELLKRQDLTAPAKRALQIRQEVGSAAVKKVYAMRNAATSYGRLHDLYLYYAAHTGRATGNGPQPANLPGSGPDCNQCPRCSSYFVAGLKSCPSCFMPIPPGAKVKEWNHEIAEFAFELIRGRSMHLLEYYFGSAQPVVSACLRGLFIAKPGHDLLGVDYNSIEAVTGAALAGEEWRLEVFRTHAKIYEMSAAKIAGIPFEEFMIHAGYTAQQLSQDKWWEQKPENKGKHHPLRKRGKIAELSSFYQGWLNAWLQFGAGEFMSDEEIKTAILAWRAESPMVVELWGGQPSWRRNEYWGAEGIFVQAVMYPGYTFEYRGIQTVMRGDAVYIRLHSGREMTYHRPRLSPSDRGGYEISYERWNTNPTNGPVHQWIRVKTWGGRLVENWNQATAREIFWAGVRRCELAGYRTVLHNYDENVAEVPEGFGSVSEMERIMVEPLFWTQGWPVRAEGGWRGKRYRK